MTIESAVPRLAAVHHDTARVAPEFSTPAAGAGSRARRGRRALARGGEGETFGSPARGAQVPGCARWRPRLAAVAGR
jgi:hypothetical protein